VIQFAEGLTIHPHPVVAEVFIVKTPPAAGTLADVSAGVIAPGIKVAFTVRLLVIRSVTSHGVPVVSPVQEEKQYPVAGRAFKLTAAPLA
jgi:hypothetical protein